MACKHAALAAIYAKQMAEMDEPWKLWQWQDEMGNWNKVAGHPSWLDSWEYRQIPKTININGIEVPEPMREKPEYHTTFWHIDSGKDNGVMENIWTDSFYDNRRLARGQCHLTRDNCIIHAKALFSFTQIEE